MTLSFTNPQTLTHEQQDEGTAFAPRFDANGLVTAVVMQSGSNDLLMVSHMNAEALSLTLATGIAHYWSRSRNMLWKKGETSGEIQRVLELRVDCDQDAIQLLVEQTGRGAACHTGRKTCFYRGIETANGQVALKQLGMPRLFDPKTVY